MGDEGTSPGLPGRGDPFGELFGLPNQAGRIYVCWDVKPSILLLPGDTITRGGTSVYEFLQDGCRDVKPSAYFSPDGTFPRGGISVYECSQETKVPVQDCRAVCPQSLCAYRGLDPGPSGVDHATWRTAFQAMSVEDFQLTYLHESFDQLTGSRRQPAYIGA